jgi:hypothetical protein
MALLRGVRWEFAHTLFFPLLGTSPKTGDTISAVPGAKR